MSRSSLSIVTNTTSVKQLPLYKKAIDIYTLSRKTTAFLTKNRPLHQLYTSTDKTEVMLEEMVINALTVPPKIAVAQTTNNTKLRIESIQSIIPHIEKIRENCIQLRKLSRQNQEHTNLLSLELSKFKKMYRQWSVLLTQQN